MQLFDALDADAARAMAFNLCAHFDQHLGEVWNFRLPCGVFKNRFALGEGRGHHQIFSAGHRHHVGGDAGTLHAGAPFGQARDHVTVFHGDLGAHGLQALDVLVHWARTNGAAARQGDGGLAKTRQQRPQRQH